MVDARRTVVAAACSMCWGCVRCKAWNPIAALSTACRKYTRTLVESATTRAMTSVRVSCRIRFGGRVTMLVGGRAYWVHGRVPGADDWRRCIVHDGGRPEVVYQ